jgi:hypothetical protein
MKRIPVSGPVSADALPVGHGVDALLLLPAGIWLSVKPDESKIKADMPTAIIVLPTAVGPLPAMWLLLTGADPLLAT